MNRGSNIVKDYGMPWIFEKMLYSPKSNYSTSDKCLVISAKASDEEIESIKTSYEVAKCLVSFLKEKENGFSLKMAYFRPNMLNSLGYLIEESNKLFWFIPLDNKSFFDLYWQRLEYGAQVYVGSRMKSIVAASRVFAPNYSAYINDAFMTLGPKKRTHMGVVKEMLEHLLKDGVMALDLPMSKTMNVRSYLWNMGVKGVSFSSEGGKMIVRMNGEKKGIASQLVSAQTFIEQGLDFEIEGDYSYSYVYQFMSNNRYTEKMKLTKTNNGLVLSPKQTSESFADFVRDSIAPLFDGESFVKIPLSEKDIKKFRSVLTKNYSGQLQTSIMHSDDGFRLRIWKKQA